MGRKIKAAQSGGSMVGTVGVSGVVVLLLDGGYGVQQVAGRKLTLGRIVGGWHAAVGEGERRRGGGYEVLGPDGSAR